MKICRTIVSTHGSTKSKIMELERTRKSLWYKSTRGKSKRKTPLRLPSWDGQAVGPRSTGA